VNADRRFVALLCLLVVASSGRGLPAGGGTPVSPCRATARLPHDPTAFTQGLVFADGLLYESIGGYGISELRAVEPSGGRIVRRRRLSARFFAEGLTVVDGLLVQLTWKAGRGLCYDRKRFAIRRTFVYDHEGWGAAYDGAFLYVSDGSSVIRRYEVTSFREHDRFVVRDAGVPLPRLNELEFVGRELWANVWHHARIARIDPTNGEVRGWLDCRDLARQAAPAGDSEAVLNGIAWDRSTGRIFVTGKRWPWLFTLAPPPSWR